MTKFISKLSVLFVAVFAVSASAFADDLTLTHDLTDFEEIRIDNAAIELFVLVGEDYEIIVTGDEVNVRNLKLKVRGDRLVIYSEEDDKKIWNRSGNSRLEVNIKMPKFTKLDLRGAVDAKINNIDSEDVIFDIKGAGNFEVDGKCQSLTIELRGAGNFEGEDLICEEVDVDLKGAGNIEVYASEIINAEINGMGNIDVFGNPKKVSKDDGFFSSISIH